MLPYRTTGLCAEPGSYKCHIIVLRSEAGECIGRFEKSFDDSGRFHGRAGFERAKHVFFTPFFVLFIHGLTDTIAEQEKQVPWFDARRIRSAID